MFSLKNSKICTFFLKILKICSYMHLFKKWLKYAFAYASMQMHNYPKPRSKGFNEQHNINFFNCMITHTVANIRNSIWCKRMMF